MDCGVEFDPFIGAMFWGLPLFAGYWIWRRKKIPGASLTMGRGILILWAATFPLLIISLFAGFSKLHGNSAESQCWTMIGVFALLTTAYVLLFRTLKAGPNAPDGTS